jgi:hypothetical protein
MLATLPRRSLVGHFALRLGSAGSADLTVLAGQIGGGSVYAEVVTETAGAAVFVKKHLGPTKYESFVLPVGLVVSDELFKWLAASWSAQPPQKDGAVLTLDYQWAVTAQAAFSAALIQDTSFPALDAASSDEGHVTIDVQPATITMGPGSGVASLIGGKQKLWRTAGFRLQIDGLDCTRVVRIEPFRVHREVQVETQGIGVVNLVPGKINFPNLTITLAKISSMSWYDWHEQFVVEGKNGETFEREGSLSFLAADMQTELARIDLHHLGIIKIAPAEDKALYVTAELYCEEMVLSQPGDEA